MQKIGNHLRIIDGGNPARGVLIRARLRNLFQYESGLHHAVDPLGQCSMEDRYFERLQTCFGIRWGSRKQPAVYPPIDSFEIPAHFHGTGFSLWCPQKPAIRRIEAGVGYRKLKEASGAKNAMNFFQGPAMIRHVHETHHGGSKIELPWPKRQLQSAGGGISNGLFVSPFHFGREADERWGNINGEHLRAPLGKQTGVMPFSATYIETSLSGHIRKQIEEGGRVERVAIDIPALACKEGPGERITFPIASRQPMVHDLFSSLLHDRRRSSQGLNLDSAAHEETNSNRWNLRQGRAGLGSWVSSLGSQLLLPVERDYFPFSDIGVNLVPIDVISCHSSVNLGQRQVRVFEDNLFRRHAHFVPDGNSADGQSDPGDLRPSAPNRQLTAPVYIIAVGGAGSSGLPAFRNGTCTITTISIASAINAAMSGDVHFSSVTS